MITRWPLRWDWYVMKFGVQSFDYKELKYGFSALCTKDFFNPCIWELGVQQIISSWFFYLVVMSLLESVQISLGELPFWLLLGVRELTNHWHANLHFRKGYWGIQTLLSNCRADILMLWFDLCTVQFLEFSQ